LNIFKIASLILTSSFPDVAFPPAAQHILKSILNSGNMSSSSRLARILPIDKRFQSFPLMPSDFYDAQAEPLSTLVFHYYF
jgi:hypothetical protein